MYVIVPTLSDTALCDIGFPYKTVSKTHAEQLFAFFKEHTLFNWKDSSNHCEARADAVCILLDEWGIPNYKGWVFSGAYLKNHIGALKQNWKYHVAPVLLVEQEGRIVHYVLDPATANALQPIESWAAAITLLPHSYYFTRQSHWYIFPNTNISTEKWNTRNKRNRKWMIQCLTGINGLTTIGKAQLCFNKKQIKITLLSLNNAKKGKPNME